MKPSLPILPPLDVRRILRRAGLRPHKSLGQNFLIDEHALSRVASAADLGPRDTVLEVGAGIGSLTRHLALRARQVVALEIDDALLPILREVLASFPNVAVLHADVLAQPVEKFLAGWEAGGYCIVANIPYYITSAIIRHVMEARVRPSRMVLTVQKEVAERICAKAGKMNLLALSVQYYGEPAVWERIPATAFYPAPKVDSAVVRIALTRAEERDPAVTEGLFRVAKAGFSQKRKTLRNALAAGLRRSPDEVERRLHCAAVEPRRRAETLSVEEWLAVAECFSEDDVSEEGKARGLT